MSRPADTLTTPTAEDPIPPGIPFLVGGNFVSPAYYLSQFIQSNGGVDPFGWVSEQFAGDWEKVKQAANAAGGLGRFNTAFGETVKTDWESMLGSSWRGNAADGAKRYHDQLAGAVEWQIAALGEIERSINNISNEMANLARVVGDLLQGIVDIAIMTIAELAAGAVLSSSLVGSPAAAAMYATAAAHIVFMVARIQKLIDTVTTVYQVVVGLSVVVMDKAGRMPEPLPELAMSAYDHPGV